MSQKTQINIYPIDHAEEKNRLSLDSLTSDKTQKVIISVSSKWWFRTEINLMPQKDAVVSRKVSHTNISSLRLNWDIRNGDHRIKLYEQKTMSDYSKRKEKILKFSIIPAVLIAVVIISFILNFYTKF